MNDIEGENSSGVVSFVSEKVKVFCFYFFVFKLIDFWSFICSMCVYKFVKILCFGVVIGICKIVRILV